MSNQTLQLSKNIKEEIINYANKEIAKIKLNYLINKKLSIEYIPDNKITNKLTALESIDKQKYSELINELLNYKCEIFDKKINIISYEYNLLAVITHLEIPF